MDLTASNFELIEGQLTEQLQLSNPLLLATTPKKAEYKVSVISEGFVRRRDGQTSNIYFPSEVVAASTPLLNNTGCFIDHPAESLWGPGYPQTKFLAGVFHSPEWNESTKTIDAVLRLYSRSDLIWLAELLDEYLADLKAGQPVPDLGLSASLFLDSEWVGEGEQRIRRALKIRHYESVDFVYRPGLQGKFLERLSASPLWGAGGDKNIIITLGGTMSGNNPTLPTSDPAPPVSPPEPQAALVPATPDPLATRIEKLESGIATIMTNLDKLTTALAKDEDANLVQNMGQPPIRPYIHSQLSSLEQFGPVVDWLFGVKDSPLPDPQFRRADTIYRALTGDYEFRGVFQPDQVWLASANTSTLSNLAVNAMNKVIVAQFSNLRFWRWYESIVWVAPNDGSLHDMQWITFGGISNLPTVAEGAAFTELTTDDVKEADSWVTKGGYVGITRKMIKNSDIQRIQAVPVALATACIRTRSAAVSAIFTDNSGVGPTLDQDSTALFHSNHSNLGTTALSASEWRVVRTAIFKHTDVNSAKRLGYFPKFALVPPDLYDSALIAFGYGEGMPTAYTPEAQGRGLDDPRPVPLAVPDWTDTNNWAAIVDPLVFPIIGMSYSQSPGGGVHPPCELFTAMDPNGGLLFSNDTLPIKVRDEFVVGVNGPRGVYKENVA